MTSERDLIGHKLMLAFAGTTVPEYIANWLAHKPVGGFTLFRHFNVTSPAQVRDLTGALQRMAAIHGHPPLLIAADQEGGQLIALGDQTTQFPGNMALAATNDPTLAYEAGLAMGREIAALGVNMVYAPVADVNTNPENPGLGIRTFSDNPALAASMVGAMVRGLQDAGVAATIKHFPGLGEVNADSHLHMPRVDHTRERLDTTELTPFRAGIDAGAKLLMSGHVAVPALTGSDELPATVSPTIMTDFVRGVMRFEGVTITDALDMGAITQGAGQIIDVLAAIRAGVDLMLLTANQEMQERIESSLRLAHSRQLIETQHIVPSIERIFALRQWLASHPQPDLAVVGSTEHQQLARRIADQSVTLVRNDAGLLPLKLHEGARIAAVMPKPIDLTPADTSSYVKPTLASALKAHHRHVDEFITAHIPRLEEIATLRETLSGYDLIVIGTISASMNSRQSELVQAVLGLGIPIITVALRTPYDLTAYPDAQTHICTYSIQEAAMQSLAATIFGKSEFCGKLPVTLPNLYQFQHGLRH